MDKPDPLADCGEQDEAEEAAGSVVVSGGYTPAVLEPVEELLDSASRITTGTFAAKPQGGDTRSHRIEAFRDAILVAIEAQKDVTLVELAEMLAREHGARLAPSTV